MKKILILSLGIIVLSSNIVFAFSGTTNTVTSAADKIIPANLQCVQGAVTIREAAVASTLSTFFVSVTTSLATRASALDTAWGITDSKARRDARNAAWNTYKNSTQNSRKIFRTNKKAAWDTFKATSLKTCKTPVVETETDDNLPL